MFVISEFLCNFAPRKIHSSYSYDKKSRKHNKQ